MAKDTHGYTHGSMDRVSRIRRMLEEGEDSSLFSPNFVSRTPWDYAANRSTKRAGDEKAQFFAATSMFSNPRISVEEAIEEGDKVVVRWRLRGTWAKSFSGLKATGKPMEITGINIYRFVGDSIVEETGELDLASFASQAMSAGINAADCAQVLDQLSRPPELTGRIGGQG